jgi:hypothetical protein
MTFEEMQQQWMAQERRIDTLVRVNRELLRERTARPLRKSMTRLSVFSALEAVAAAAGLLWTGSFLFVNWAEPRFLLPGLALHLWLAAALGASVYEITLARSLDYAAPLPELQRRVAELRAFRIRSMRVALLTGQVVWWIPFGIVALWGLFGVDLYRLVSLEHLLLQVGAGLALVALLPWAARLLVRSGAATGALAGTSRLLAGTDLASAERALTELARFETDHL